MIGFVLKIHFELKNGKKIAFEGSGCQEAVANYFEDWPSMTISPKRMANVNTVDELIALLTENVLDGDRKIFEESRTIRSDVVKGSFDAYDFVNLIKDNIVSIDDIAKIRVVLKEYNELHYYREYVFDRETNTYTRIEFGTPEAAEDCYGEWMDQTIISFSDLNESKLKKRKDIYRESDSDDIYFDWVGCSIIE
jgi:hypothetical protein